MCRWWIIGYFLIVILAGCQPVLLADEVVDDGVQQDRLQETGDSSTEISGLDRVDHITATDVMTSVESPSTEPDIPLAGVAGDASVDSRLVLEGMTIYREQYCGICHELAAAETTGTFGPAHDGIGSRAALRIQDAAYTGNALTAEEYLRESIVEPAAYLVEGYAITSHAMPPYAHLDDSDINALVAFLLVQQ